MPNAVFILDDEKIFHPLMMHSIIKQVSESFDISILIVCRIPKTNSIYRLFTENIQHIPWHHYALLGFRVAAVRTFRLLSRCFGSELGVCTSLRAVARHWGLSHHFLNGSLDDHCMTWLDAQNPSVIISSTSIIFREPFVTKYSGRLVNRHSGDLKYYGGLWPIIYAVADACPEICVTLHHIDEGIDTGAVVDTQSFERKTGSLFDLYRLAFSHSATLICRVLQTYTWHNTDAKKQIRAYNRMPNGTTIRRFIENGGRFY